MLAQPAPEPLLSFSSTAQPASDPFDLLGLNDVPVQQPAQTPHSKVPGGDLSQLKHEVVETISKTLTGSSVQGSSTGDLLGSIASAEQLHQASDYSDGFVDNLKAQIEMWKV